LGLTNHAEIILKVFPSRAYVQCPPPPSLCKDFLSQFRRALLNRKTLASALTSLAKFLANNLRDQTLAKKWKFKKNKKKTDPSWNKWQK
jgi:hypothetical protein